jgi:hypothetical protein
MHLSVPSSFRDWAPKRTPLCSFLITASNSTSFIVMSHQNTAIELVSPPVSKLVDDYKKHVRIELVEESRLGSSPSRNITSINEKLAQLKQTLVFSSRWSQYRNALFKLTSFFGPSALTALPTFIQTTNKQLFLLVQSFSTSFILWFLSL